LIKKAQLILVVFIFSISCEKNNLNQANNTEQGLEIEVSVVLSENCPIAQYMTLPLKNSYEEFAADSVVFTAYFPNLLSSQQTISDFAQKYSIPFDCIDDNNGEIVSLLGASVYSEVFVKLNGELVYKGMVDDSYTDLGQWGPADNNYLYDVLERLIEGVGVEYFETEAVGCLI